MTKINSADITSAINYAQTDPKISVELRRRDTDKRLDCSYINCKVISKINNPVKRFEIIFNYVFIAQNDQKGEDIIVTIEKSARGDLRIENWKTI